MYDYQSVACAFTSPVSMKYCMLVMWCMQFMYATNVAHSKAMMHLVVVYIGWSCVVCGF